MSYIIFGVWNIYRNKIVPAYITSSLLVVASYNALITRMNFSKSASIIIAVGYILFVSSLVDDNWKSKWYRILRIISYVFIIGGFLIRWDTCLASLPFLFILVAYIFFSYKKQISRIIPFIGIIISIVLIWGSNYIAYNVDSDWKYWSEYNAERATLLDYYMVDYDDYAEQFEEIGISRNDYEALKDWIYADDETFDLETMRKIVVIRNQSYNQYFKINKQNLETSILNCLDLLKNNSIIYVAIFLFLMIVPLLSGKETITLMSVFIVSMGEIFYLIFLQRCPERALFLPIMILFAAVIFFMNKVDVNKEWVISLLTVFVLVYSFYASNLYCINRLQGYQYSNRDETIRMLEELSSRESNLYVWDGHERDLLRFVYSPKDVPEFGIEKNFVMLGGWSVPSPIMSDRTEIYGEKYNYLKLLAENENVYFISKSDESLGIIEQYIREHYNSEVKTELTETIGTYKIYSFKAD